MEFTVYLLVCNPNVGSWLSRSSLAGQFWQGVKFSWSIAEQRCIRYDLKLLLTHLIKVRGAKSMDRWKFLATNTFCGNGFRIHMCMSSMLVQFLDR